jgi:hypothetical protein
MHLRGVVAFPDVRIALGIDFEIKPTLLIEDVWEPRVIAPVGLNHDGIVWLLSSEEIVNGVAFAARIPVRPELRSLGTDGRAKQ